MKKLSVALAFLSIPFFSCHKNYDRAICGKYAGQLHSSFSVAPPGVGNDTSYNDTIIIENCNKGKSFCIANGNLSILANPELDIQFDYSGSNQYNYSHGYDDVEINYISSNDSVHIYSSYHISAAASTIKIFSGKKI